MKKVKNVLWAIGCIVVFGLVILAFVMPVDDPFWGGNGAWKDDYMNFELRRVK